MRERLERIGGAFRLESAAGQGTRVRASLSLAPAAPAAPAAPPARIPSPPAPPP
jgi:signal transduction histidine kinase